MAEPIVTPRMDAAASAAAAELSRRGVRPHLRAPGYDLERFLGYGAYGEVWTAIHRNSGRRVAIKFFTRRGGFDWHALAREVDKLRHLFTDRHVVQLFEVGWDAEPPYYVMEFMENGSLEERLRHGPLPLSTAIEYFREIAVALRHAHDRGILHCDLKPANILLDSEQRPRLADFGQARLRQEAAPALGTLYYMAPEQADLEAVPDARWDVYALGAVMYCMLTGAPPYYREEPLPGGSLTEQLAAYRRLLQSAPPPQTHRRIRGVDAELAAIIDRCLALDPSRRFANPHEVIQALDAWQLRQVRRPLLVLTSLAILLLMGALGSVGAYLFWTTVTTAEQEVVRRALEANQFAAAAEARQMALEIEHRWRILEFEAADPQLHRWLTDPALRQLRDQQAANHPAWQALDRWLEDRRRKYNEDFRIGATASVWTVLDADGYLLGAGPRTAYRLHYFGFRDYFHGQGRDVAARQGPPPTIVRTPHRSIVYRRRTSRTWAVTFSVPVWPSSREQPSVELLAAAGGTIAALPPPIRPPIGVLTMSVDLGDDAADDPARFAGLIDLRPDEKEARPGLIVRHPYMAALPDDLPEEQLPLVYASEIATALADSERTQWASAFYEDPVAGGTVESAEEAATLAAVRESFRGMWLLAVQKVVIAAGSGRRIDTGFAVFVQSRREGVLEPVRALQWRLGSGAAVGGIVVVVLLAVWVTGLAAILQDSPRSRVGRWLRRWAGLPTTTETAAILRRASPSGLAAVSTVSWPAPAAAVSEPSQER